MSTYAIGIGGSGARSMEALLYLCAAGLGPPDDLTLAFVDPDRNNGSVKRTLSIARLYARLQDFRRGKQCGFLQTKIHLVEPEVWSPFHDGQTAPTLESFFEYHTLKQVHAEQASLFDMLYTPEQREATLDIGFRGRPAIGAAVFGAKIDAKGEEPWKTLSAKILTQANNAQDVRVFAFGSLFGGTGAAGLPTIPRLIAAGAPSVKVGACLLLPYFVFDPQPAGGKEELYARPEGFMLNSKEALRYYSMFNPVYDRLYLLGVEEPSVRGKFSIGGSSQNNAASVVELLAALGARDFYEALNPKDGKVALIARRNKAEFNWADVPGTEKVHPQLARLARMSFTFLTLFYPRLQEIWKRDSRALRTPWYVDHFVDQNASATDCAPAIEAQKDFSTCFLRWLREIHLGPEGKEGWLKVRLASTAALPANDEGPVELSEFHFPDIMLETGVRSKTTGDVWRLMCNSGRGRLTDVSGFGCFQRRLYDACA